MMRAGLGWHPRLPREVAAAAVWAMKVWEMKVWEMKVWSG